MVWLGSQIVGMKAERAGVAEIPVCKRVSVVCLVYESGRHEGYREKPVALISGS